MAPPIRLQFIEAVTREYGASARTFKSALVWCVPDSASALHDKARKLLAWEDIQGEEDELRLDDAQKRQLNESIRTIPLLGIVVVVDRVH
jgi:hypothetical protein